MSKYDKRYFIVLALLGLLFISSCANEYSDFHLENAAYEKNISDIVDNKEKFKLTNILYSDVKIATLPDNTTLDRIIDNIKSAKKRVYLEVYILTEKRIIKELTDAKRRGLDVSVILEKNVLGSPSINSKAFKILQNVGIKVRYANNNNYIFTHSKFFIFDDSYILGTGNMSHSTFYDNMEFYLFGKDKKNISILESVFSDDMNGIRSIHCDANVITSPFCSRFAFEKTLNQAKSSIYIYAQQIKDPSLEKILKSKAEQGIKISMILADPKKVSSNQNIIDDFKKTDNVSIYIPKKSYVHAKVFIIDNETIYIGSINFTSNSMDNNREVGFIFNDKENADNLIRQFNNHIGQ
ncbi:MAG: phospholipase D-like domain-containing protein [Candidatus Gracilibacteria bacterium]|nr:phospholipase D-like domain-containing protein [Candidatus Gracilibacteria bacterium]